MERPAKRVSPSSTAAVCLAVLDKLCFGFAELCVHFLDPVDCVLYPDYVRLVAEPMDLGTVRRRLRNESSYAGEAFAADVRKCFGNAMLFNLPQDPVYAAAVTLLARFEREWSKFADEPPEVPLLPRPRRGAASAVTGAAVTEGGKLVIKMTKKRAAPSSETTDAHEAADALRRRAQELMLFGDMVVAGYSLEKATLATIQHWRTAPIANYPVSALESEARGMISVLEDTEQSANKIMSWLKEHLLPIEETSKREHLLHYVLAIMAGENEPLVDPVALLIKTPQLAASARLWTAVLRSVSSHASAVRVLSVLKRLIPLKSTTAFGVFLSELNVQSSMAQVQEGLDRFAKWLLVEQTPSRIDWLARTCSGFPSLRQSIGRLAVDAVLHAADVESLSELVQLSYGPDVSASVVKHLLLARQPEKAAAVTDMLLRQQPGRLAMLLRECFEAAKDDSDCYQQLTVSLVKKTLESLPLDAQRAFLAQYVSVPNSSRQQRFANIVASTFLEAHTSLAGLLSALVSLAWVSNSIAPSIMAPAVALAQRQLKAKQAPVEAVMQALFALECALPENYESWKAESDALLQALVQYSSETEAEHLRILQFKRVAIKKF